MNETRPKPRASAVQYRVWRHVQKCPGATIGETARALSLPVPAVAAAALALADRGLFDIHRDPETEAPR